MRATHLEIALVAGLAASAAVAHQGVKDPQVKARMDAMAEIGAATKVIGEMVKGARAFDAEAARNAAAAIAEQAVRVPGLFEAPADDPVSEAMPAIWEDFGDFAEKAEAMEVAARDAMGVARPGDAADALRALGETCKACHKHYRE